MGDGFNTFTDTMLTETLIGRNTVIGIVARRVLDTFFKIKIPAYLEKNSEFFVVYF